MFCSSRCANTAVDVIFLHHLNYWWITHSLRYKMLDFYGFTILGECCIVDFINKKIHVFQFHCHFVKMCATLWRWCNSSRCLLQYQRRAFTKPGYKVCGWRNFSRRLSPSHTVTFQGLRLTTFQKRSDTAIYVANRIDTYIKRLYTWFFIFALSRLHRSDDTNVALK